MKRRAFIAALGGAAAWPVVAGGQQTERVRHIGVLSPLAADDPEEKMRIAAFLQSLQQLGWIDGRNMRVDYRSSADNDADARKYAAELAALAPDLILAAGSATVGSLLQMNRTVPVVFVTVVDPVGAGFADSLSRPGGNATGFTNFEYGTSTKWLELLKDIAPGITRVAVIRDPTVLFASGELGAIQSAAPSFRVEVRPLGARGASEIERGIAAFASGSNGGLIVLGSTVTLAHRNLIITLAAKHRLPAVYSGRHYVTDGGLMSYGPDRADQYRRAAGYVDRILKGEKPADLPVQAPTRYELAINLKTAKALGLDVPHSLLARADEVIE